MAKNQTANHLRIDPGVLQDLEDSGATSIRSIVLVFDLPEHFVAGDIPDNATKVVTGSKSYATCNCSECNYTNAVMMLMSIMDYIEVSEQDFAELFAEATRRFRVARHGGLH